MVPDEYLGTYLIPLTVFHTLVTMTGIVGNATMCVITVRDKNLHSPCHILIGLTCLCDALHGSAHIPFLYGLYTNTKWILQKNCYFVQFLPAFGAMGGMSLLLCLGVDRLIAIVFPTLYRQNQESKLYVIGHFSVPFLYFTAFAVYAWFCRVDVPVMCVTPEFFGSATPDYILSAVVINIMILLVYILVFYKLQKSGLTKSAKSISKSIFVTVIFVVGGWFTTILINFTAAQMGATGNTMFLIESYAGIPVNFACASNVFVYYNISGDYRSAIRQLLFSGKTEAVVHITQAATEMNRRATISDVSVNSSEQMFARRASVNP